MKATHLLILGLTLIFAAVALVWPPFVTFINIDSCLDMGGVYDYAANVCDFEQSHPYAPKDNRAQLRLAAACVVIGIVLTMVGYHRRKRAMEER
jgi:hypothetical protein